MTQKAQRDFSETSSWITESDQFDIADEVQRACTRLQDAIKEEKAARESLESLFRKRREDALDEVRKAQDHLGFVHEEEERLRKTLSYEHLTASKVINKDTRRQVTNNRTLFEPSSKSHPDDKAESVTKECSSEEYITNTVTSIDENRQYDDVDHFGPLVQRLENNLERLRTRATGLQIDSGSRSSESAEQLRYSKAKQ